MMFMIKTSQVDWTAVFKAKNESESEIRSVVSDSSPPHGLCGSWSSPGQNTGVGSLSFLQGSFPAQGSNPSLPRCRQILHQLSHQGNPPDLLAFSFPYLDSPHWFLPLLSLKLFCRPRVTSLSQFALKLLGFKTKIPTSQEPSQLGTNQDVCWV